MSSYSSLILAHGSLSAYYRMNEAAAATTVDDSGPNNLDVAGGLVASCTTYGVTGALVNDSNTALSFDGSADPMGLTNNVAYDLGDGPFSIELWVKRITTGTAQTVLIKGPGTGAYAVRFTTGNRVQFSTASAGNLFSSTTILTDTASWHHIVVTKNGATRQMYIDGVAETAQSGSNTTLTDNSTFLLIGGTTGGRYVGGIDEVALYKGAVLSADEVLQHYRTGLGAMTLTDSVTLSDSASKEPGPVLSDTATLSDSQAKDVGQGLSDTATLSDANAKDVGQALSDSVGPTDAAGNAPGTFPADSVTLSDSTSSEPGLVKADTVTLSDNESAESGLGASLSDSVTPTDSQVADVGASLSDTATLSDALSAADAIVIDDTVTLSDDLTATAPIMQAIDDSVSLFDMLSTHLETEGAGGGQQPGFGMVRVPVLVRETRLSFADVLLLHDELEAQNETPPLSPAKRQRELAALL